MRFTYLSKRSFVTVSYTHLDVYKRQLFHSTILVAIAETGDKTQLLSIILAARFRKFWPLFWGILIATLFNHALAAFLGSFIAGFAASFWVNLIAAIAFIAIGLWILIPDDEPDEDQEPKYGAFITTLIAFFMACLLYTSRCV